MAQARTFFLEIVTPDGRVFSGDVEYAVVPAIEGEVGVMAGHAALLSEINMGELRLVHAGQTDLFAVETGVLEIRENRVSVAVESAQRPSDVDRETLQLMRLQAEHAIAENRDPLSVSRGQDKLKLVVLLEKLGSHQRNVKSPQDSRHIRE